MIEREEKGEGNRDRKSLTIFRSFFGSKIEIEYRKRNSASYSF